MAWVIERGGAHLTPRGWRPASARCDRCDARRPTKFAAARAALNPGLLARVLPTRAQIMWACLDPTGVIAALASASALAPAASAAGRDTDTVRLTWGFGGLPLIAKERGEFAKTLAKDNIRVEWIGPFPNHAPTIQAVVGGSADFSFGGSTTPALAAILAGTCWGAIPGWLRRLTTMRVCL